MESLKTLHIICAILTGCLFLVRGIWMIQNSLVLQYKIIKVLPHLIDTVLLVTALAMLVGYGLNPFEHGWLMAKILTLLVYISLGLFAFRFSQRKSSKVAFWLLALLALGFIYYLAFTKHLPHLWL